MLIKKNIGDEKNNLVGVVGVGGEVGVGVGVGVGGGVGGGMGVGGAVGVGGVAEVVEEVDEIEIDSENGEENGDDYLDDEIKTLATIVSKPQIAQNHKVKPLNIKKSTYTDPNVYLKLDPIKSIQSNLARSINYEHVIITRFSYRFRKDYPIKNLFDSERLTRRFQLFETFCLPSVLSQINPNFYWVIVVDTELPTNYLDILWKNIAKFYSSSLYATRGPRQIFVHRWEYTSTLAHIDWLQKLIPLNRKYLVTTRLDDDDSISRDFTNQVADVIRTSLIKSFKLISFSNGYYWYNQPTLSYGIFKATNRPWIAIGLTMITEREKYPITVYFGNHTKLVNHIRNWKNHSMLKHYIEAAKEEYDAKVVLEKYEVIRKNTPVYIRSVHGFNLQKNEKNEYLNRDYKNKDKEDKDEKPKHLNVHNLNLLNQYFTINQSLLEIINVTI